MSPKKKKKKPRYQNPPATKRRKRGRVSLNVLPDGIWLRVKRGVTVWEALQKTDFELEGDCGGLGKCGKCRIRVITAIGSPSSTEREYLTDDDLKNGIRLACQTRIRKDLVIQTETDDQETEVFQILKYGDTPAFEIDTLVKKHPLFLNPPSIADDLSDVDRIRTALGPYYRSSTFSPRCLVNLYHDLRATDFQGVVVLRNKQILGWEPEEKADRNYGLAIDLGSSTLVAKLIDLIWGQELTVASRLNSQTRYGSDVISRIQYVMDQPKGLEAMRSRLLRDINILIRNLSEASNVDPEEIYSVVIAGNTTMQHFLLGLNPSGIAEAPFSPVITDSLILEAREVGLQINPEGFVFVMPAKTGYIGGDLIAFILASGAADQTDRLVLGLDFGTNGEIFLGNGSKMLTCSAAAGPALEGARITHGMIGKTGAIEGARFEENGIFYQVIGNVPPKGLCGSGLVDIIALLLHHDLIDSEGLLRPPNDQIRTGIIDRLKMQNGKEVYDFLLTTADESYNSKSIYLTQQDIRELQLAKGAIAAGINILLDMMEASIEDIDEICLAGALGNYINPLSAMRVGLLPKVNPLIINPMGNAASTGAKMALLSEEYWQKASAINKIIDHVELSSHPEFLENFIREMDFPVENLW